MDGNLNTNVYIRLSFQRAGLRGRRVVFLSCFLRWSWIRRCFALETFPTTEATWTLAS